MHVVPPRPRGSDPKFRAPRYAQYLSAVAALDRFARERYGKSVLALAVRWVLDQSGVQMALVGRAQSGAARAARRRDGVGARRDAAKQTIEAIVREHVTDPVGPEFMAPPARTARRAVEVVRRSA